MSDIKKCDRCGENIETNEQITIIDGTDAKDYCAAPCLGEVLAAMLLSNGELYLEKTDERTYAV